MSLEIIQPYKPQPIQFKSPDDFNIYYNKHADEFKETTYKLNVKYKIPGFKITKIKGELKLIKDYANAHKNVETAQTHVTNNEDIKRLESHIKSLEERLASIEQYLSSLNA